MTPEEQELFQKFFHGMAVSCLAEEHEHLRARVDDLQDKLSASVALTQHREAQLLAEIHQPTFRDWLAEELERDPGFAEAMAELDPWYKLHSAISNYRNRHGTWRLLRELIRATVVWHWPGKD